MITEKEKINIEQAIQKMETSTSGELVVYFAKDSSNYNQGIWIPTVLSTVLSFLFLYGLGELWLLPSEFDVNHGMAFTLLIMVISFCLFYFVKRLRLWFIGKQNIDIETLQKAQSIFIDEDMFNTRDRTGILIFISQLEHKVIVLGDKGINAKIEQSDWEHILELVVAGIKSKSIGENIVKAIELCEELLLSNGFNVRKDDTNELSNHVRIEK